jgi:hypothetical protein
MSPIRRCACARSPSLILSDAQESYGGDDGDDDAFPRNMIARDAHFRACGRLWRGDDAGDAPSVAHVEGEVYFCARASAAAAEGLRDVYVWRGDEGDHKWAPFSAPLLHGETGAAGEPLLTSADIRAALGGALYSALQFNVRALDDVVDELDATAGESENAGEANAWRVAAAALRECGLGALVYARPIELPGGDRNRGCVFPHFILGKTPLGSLAGVVGLTVWT